MKQEIKASFKQATIKAGTATLQFEVLPSAEGFTEVMKMTGGVVMLTVETEQQELPLDEEQPTEGVVMLTVETEQQELPLDEEQPTEGQTTINNCFVNAETGEVTDYEETIEAEIEDFDRALPEGGEE